MVSFLNAGRLGNFLYETAASFSYAKKHGLEFSVPDRTNDHFWNPITFPHLIHPNFRPYNPSDIMINELWNREQHFYEIEFDESWRERNIFLNGYWQSFRQFDWCRDELLEAFGYPYEMNKGVCSIHVRRGDYLLYPRLHPVVTLEYISGAVNTILQRDESVRFKIFSDDIEWCKRNIPGIYGEAVEYSEGKTPEQDLVEMANCEHQICSNSTLALWGAELNQNPNKIVVVPDEENWFGIDNKKMTVKDLYRPEWIRISYPQNY